tara:strand:+ start:481 stop:702 length:222 start_codon:yes stop_codon:yes gene_type:complete
MLQFQMGPEEAFWQEKMMRSIKECSSISELKEMATLLTKIATMRQVAIKGLIKDAMDLMSNQVGHDILNHIKD